MTRGFPSRSRFVLYVSAKESEDPIGFEALTDQKSIQPLQLAFVGNLLAASKALLQRSGHEEPVR